MRILIVILSLFLTCFSSEASNSNFIISVDAGDATTICYGETLSLAELDASISGDVSDGLWFSQGDGVFLPSGESNGVFSTTTQYQPGQQDQSTGSFTLILVSDDPDGNGPMVEVSDVVTISFINAPALVCNNDINVSLSEGCQQLVDIFMLLANPSEPYDKYIIELFDEGGNEIPGDTLTVEHIGTNISFVVGHDCNNNTCDGNISISDNIAPFLNCQDAEVNCETGVDPESVGFPIPFYAIPTSTGDKTYSVVDFDDCGLVTLSYEDIEQELQCATTGFIKEITRSWFAEDESGNTASCQQSIFVIPLPIDSVKLPQNLDGIANPVLSCDGNWIALDSGYPSPETTGSPAFPDCGNIATSYTDVFFEECGAGFKILRQWTVVEWCTVTTINHNQIIKVLDIDGPQFECPEDITLSSQAYTCASKLTELSFVDEVTDCSEYGSSYKILDQDGIDVSSQYLDENNIEDLPLGIYELVYVATDICGNSSECSTNITVIDNSAPFAVCNGFTQIAVGSNGHAELFASSVNDDSFDNCGDITMAIAKVTDDCGWGLNFGPTARFCCDEIGDTVMVAFRVTDQQGLSNTCMVTVFIEDKLPPVIECPTDLTISCQYAFDINNLDIFGQVLEGDSPNGDIIIDGEVLGQNGFYYDNCGASVEEISDIDTDCGSGTITRTFTATDLYGEIAQCTQTITIVNDALFLEADITWPGNIVTDGCDTLQATADITGEPIFNMDKCALPASTYTDQVFYISGGACIKILREWTVIDWCQYDTQGDQGLWTFLQEIKLKNTKAPVFLECSDQEICSYDEDCQSEEVTITAYTNDDCTDSLDLLYIWNLDIGDNGSIDETGQGIEFNRTLDLGAHRVYWTVEDGCGNATNCDYRIDIRDCKNPTPYCRSSITTTIMPSAGEIDIWAIDYNFGSTDNCTAPEDLIFSFSADIEDDHRVIRCEDIENGVAQSFTYEMWVADEWGNQDRCAVTFIVQDNGNACPDINIKGKINGRISTQKNKFIPDAEIDIVASLDTFSGFGMTDHVGIFTYSMAPQYLDYILTPHYNSEPYLGISTLDLVKIQQHILGIKPFDNPYDILASDVSSNDRLTGIDLLTMRKMILGVITEWPNDIPNWVFVDSSFVFNPEEPFLYPNSIVISELDDSTDLANFVAVKMGDVNGSYNPNFNSSEDEISTRSGSTVDMTVNSSNRDSGYEYLLSISSDELLDGLQFSMKLGEGVTITSDYLNSSDYTLTDGELKVSWINPEQVHIGDRTFLTIQSDNPIKVQFSTALIAEAYIDQVEYNVDLESNEVLDDESRIATASYEILGNPFSDNLKVSFDLDYKVTTIEVLSVNGERVFYDSYSSTNEVSIDARYFASPGVYFIRMNIGGELVTKRVVKI